MNKKAFTLVELLAVIVVLAIVLAIAVPGITGIVRSASKSSFESDAKLVLKAIDYQKLKNESFDVTSIDKDTTVSLLGLSNDNYQSLKVVIEDNIPIITIVGQNKWAGFIACGSYRNMKVVESITDCSSDLIPPVITVLGDNPVSINVGDTYSDAGATASDNKDGDITSNITISGTINPNVPGTYTITYRVTDSAGNTTTETRTVNVIDNVAPVITFSPTGYTTYAKTRSLKVTIDDEGVINDSSLKYIWTTSTTEPLTSDFVSSFTSGDNIDTPTNVTGSYYLWITVSDNSGNKATTRSEVVNLDNIAPIITITGANPVTINRLSTYSDTGATATDNVDISVTVSSTGTVNPSVVGTYTITYNATDSSGNNATSVTRTINVIDASAPVITILGSNPVNINVGSTYTDAGTTALDDVDGDVTSKISTTGTVNPSVPGTYTITYKVKDTAGNEAVSTRTVNVIDNVAPTVAFGMNGNATWAKSRSTTVTVSDNVSVSTSSLKYQWTTSTTAPTEASFSTALTNGGTVNSPAGVSGGYYLWILAKDTVGNTSILRANVFNLDNTAPVITMSGSSPVTVSVGGTYTDAGATASDAHSGVGSVTSSGTVNPSVAGTYYIYYNVSDNAGNAATQVTRTINVLTTEYAFSYTGGSQIFTAPAAGTYKIELWGAGKGIIINSSYTANNSGAYVSGNIYLNANETLYVFIGQNSQSCAPYTLCSGIAFNGGGAGGFFTATSMNKSRQMGGAGATDVRLANGTWSDFESLKSRIMVAGGAGFGSPTSTSPANKINAGGGLNGYTGSNYNNGIGGTQTSGGTATANATAGSFGTGGDGYISYPTLPNCNDGLGGGGGYYGGGGGRGDTYTCPDRQGSGGGGSSFISGHNGCNAISESSTSGSIIHTGQANHYSGKVFTNTVMIDGAGYNWTNVKGSQVQMPKPDGSLYTLGQGNSGDGYAKITFLY